MKTLSLVECVELKFSGNILKNAICLGDCDNDGFSELILGSSNGDLAIYRDGKCICASSELGSIAAIAVGDLLNVGKNFLVVVTIEGWCHIFDVEGETTSSQKQDDSEGSLQFSPEYFVISPFHSQRIPPNTKTLHLGDVNQDGLTEMIVGLTDRVLRTYQWQKDPDDYKNILKSEEREDDGDNLDAMEGRLIGVNKWEFANQIGSVGLHKHDKVCSILVGQPGGTVTEIIEKRPSPSSNNSSTASSSATGDSGSTVQSSRAYRPDRPVTRNESPSENIVMQFHSLDVKRMQNPNISTEVIGNILSEDEKDYNTYGVATLDGTIIIARNDVIEKSLQVDNQILSLSQINGKMLACSWNGDTYLIDRKEPLRFRFEDSVAAFTAGSYAVQDDNCSGEIKLVNRNCLAYVTLHEKVYVYPIDLF